MAAPAFLLSCHWTDHCRKYFFLLHRTLKIQLLQGSKVPVSWTTPPLFDCPNHRGEVLHTQSMCLGQEDCLWVICKNPELPTQKPKQLENWGVLETLWAEPEESQQLQHHSLLSRFQEAATAVLYGMEDLLQSHPGRGLGCVQAGSESSWRGGRGIKQPPVLSSTSLPFCQGHNRALQRTRAAPWHLQINTYREVKISL